MDAAEGVAPQMPQKEYDYRLLYGLMEMFPDACPQYLRMLCFRRKYTPVVLNYIAQFVLAGRQSPKIATSKI